MSTVIANQICIINVLALLAYTYKCFTVTQITYFLTTFINTVQVEIFFIFKNFFFLFYNITILCHKCCRFELNAYLYCIILSPSTPHIYVFHITVFPLFLLFYFLVI